MDVLGINKRPGRLGIEVDSELDIAGQQRLEHFDKVLHDSVNWRALGVHLLHTAKIKQLPREHHRAIRSAHRMLQVLKRLRIGRKCFEGELRVSANRLEQVVEFMRDATSKRTNRIELLLLKKLRSRFWVILYFCIGHRAVLLIRAVASC